MPPLYFSSFEVSRQAFYRVRLAAAIVNLKPIVPGHILVIPTRPVPRLADLEHDELASLIASVQHVGRVIERVFAADGLTIACQDGKAAGQTVPHVHFHLLPRKTEGDAFPNNDDVYPALAHAEGALPGALALRQEQSVPLPTLAEDMETEARWLATFFEPSGVDV
ncbi:diadenosine hydrolase [Epithele typhae]|uniref:diadenosine hydrolase n=1 Tax=Epithele typhae TaxID=378194 RepID=UPI0020081494|nr:diadenosine hydrolase [Epithele typhae]KAH9944562.1 diadenosine hydrolase [Epithele typhae]